MASSHRRKFFLWLSIPILLVSLLLIFGFPRLFQPDHYRESFQKLLSAQLGREVTFSRARFGLWGGLGIALDDLRIRDLSQSCDLLLAQRLIVTAKALPLLLKGELRWKRVTIEKPVVRLRRDGNGQFTWLEAPAEGETVRQAPWKMVEAFSTLFGGTLSIRKGEVSLRDESFDDGPILTVIRDLDIRLSKIAKDAPFPFRMKGQILHGQKEGTLSIAGTMEGITESLDLLNGKVKAEVDLKGIELSHFWPYLRTLLPMKRIAGLLDFKLKYQGSFSGPFRTSVRVGLKEVTYDHPQVFAYVFKPKRIHIEAEAKYEGKVFEVSALSVELPEIKVKAKGRLYGLGTAEMGLEAVASSNVFDLAEGRKFIPYRIITPRVSDPLFRAEGNGKVQILSVNLSGKIPEIDHCDEPENAHVLSVEMKIHNARLKLPYDLPPLEELKGALIFKNGHLHMKEITGRVFHSTIERAEGVFYELLQVPTLEVRGEGQFHMADLIPLVKTDLFSDDPETLRLLAPIASLSGRAHYHLGVKGLLKPPLKFKHQGSYHLSKVHLVHSQIPFPVSIGEGRLDLSSEEIQWSGAKVEFGNSSLLMNGSIRRGRASEVALQGRIDLKHLHLLMRSNLFPAGFRLKADEIKGLSGTAQLLFRARKSIPSQPVSYEVELAPKEASLLFKKLSQPVLIKEGLLQFNEAGFSCSKLKVLIHHSPLLLDGSLHQGVLNLSTSGSINLKHLHPLFQTDLLPEAIRTLVEEFREPTGGIEIRLLWSGKVGEPILDLLREGEVVLKGVSFHHRALPVISSQIEGKILVTPEQIRWEKIKGKLGDSPVQLSMAISRTNTGTEGAEPKRMKQMQVDLASSQLDLDALFPERQDRGPISLEPLRQWLARFSLDGKVEIEKGRFRRIEFKDLKVEMKMVDGRLILHPFEFKTNGGMLWGEGWLQPSDRGIRFEMRPRLSHMDAPPFLRILLKKEEGEKVWLTGKVYIDRVMLAGEGENFQEIKASLRGGLRLELEQGVIEKATVLSKIFSLLNVSQLFKGRLPDLKTRGLPYQRISATVQIKDGIAATQDFLVDSDAMRITAIGKIDLGQERIDMKVGVHPLGTVDTILSHIPIAGYILTGRDRAFLSYFYEVKGNLDDPVIEAIPFKMIGEGLVGLVKRLLETPLKPFLPNNPDKK